MEMIMIELTQEEFNKVLKEREEVAKEKARIAAIKEGRKKMIEGYHQIIENGGVVQIEGGTYVCSCSSIYPVKETDFFKDRGVRFVHKI